MLLLYNFLLIVVIRNSSGMSVLISRIILEEKESRAGVTGAESGAILYGERSAREKGIIREKQILIPLRTIPPNYSCFCVEY